MTLTRTFVLLCTVMGLATAQWVAPGFYKGLEGPKFTVLKTISDNIELRRYEAGSWVSTTRQGTELDAATGGAFMKLFRYISGSNAAGAKIDMTAPVLTKVVPGQDRASSEFTLSFYNPWKYQSGAEAPKPTDNTVFINNMPAMDVYVLKFGGVASGAAYTKNVELLRDELKKKSLPFSTSHWFTAGYDSPYKFTDRHNEVWVPAATTTTAAAAAAGQRQRAAAGHKL